MKKRVLITVTEFLANGGELTLNRSIFNVQHVHIAGYLGVSEQPNMILVRPTHAIDMDFDNNRWYVEIECTPIYK